MKPILIIQNCPIESAGTIIEYLSEQALPYQVNHNYKDQPLPELDSVEAVIALGTPDSAFTYNEQPYLKNLYDYIARILRKDIPYLGICCGAQMLARVMGAKVERNHTKEIGTYHVKLTEAGSDDPIFKGFPPSFPVFQWHGDTFRIPFGAKHLAESKDCKNQAFRKGNALGFQFHFEADIKEVPTWCDSYQSELKEMNLTKEEVVDDYRQVYDEVRQLRTIFLDNLLKLL